MSDNSSVLIVFCRLLYIQINEVFKINNLPGHLCDSLGLHSSLAFIQNRKLGTIIRKHFKNVNKKTNKKKTQRQVAA